MAVGAVVVGLTAFGVLVMWVAGRDRRGWLLGIAWEVMWAVYAVVTRQWGFLASAVIFGGTFLRNYMIPPKGGSSS